MTMTIGKDDEAITVAGHDDFWKDAYRDAFKGFEAVDLSKLRYDLDIRRISSAAEYAADCALRAFAERMPESPLTKQARALGCTVVGEDGPSS